MPIMAIDWRNPATVAALSGREENAMTLHLAQLNIGRLVAPTDDPRVKEFMDNLDMINGLGKKMPGFVWMMEGAGEPGKGNTDARIDGDPQCVANLTVWEDVTSLERFVWGTVHRKFYARREKWFEMMDDMHFVMWWVLAGHEPTLDEALERLARRQRDGDTDKAFGWGWLSAARMHKTHGWRPAVA
jgi:hypothetical protein